MLLAHISDTHFRSRGEKLYGFIDVNAANADVVSQQRAARAPGRGGGERGYRQLRPPGGVSGGPPDPAA